MLRNEVHFSTLALTQPDVNLLRNVEDSSDHERIVATITAYFRRRRTGTIISLGIEYPGAHGGICESAAKVTSMKPKFIAVVVIGILAISVIATAVSAVGQATGGGSAFGVPGQVSADSHEDGDGDNSLVSSFKFVCPFH